MLERIKEFISTCYEHVSQNLVLYGVIAGLLLLVIIFIIVTCILSKNIRKYKPSYTLVEEYKNKYLSINEKYQTVINYNNLLLEEKTNLTALNHKLETDVKMFSDNSEYYKAESQKRLDELNDVKNELNDTKAELERLHKTTFVKVSASTRSADLTLENMLSMTKADLTKIATKRKMKGYTALSKEELARFVYNKIHGGANAEKN